MKIWLQRPSCTIHSSRQWSQVSISLYLPTFILPCPHKLGRDWTDTPYAGGWGTYLHKRGYWGWSSKQIHGKPEGKNKNEVMRFFPHDHLCAKKKGTRICTKCYIHIMWYDGKQSKQNELGSQLTSCYDCPCPDPPTSDFLYEIKS